MEAENIDQVREISRTTQTNDAKLGVAENVNGQKDLQCLYFKDRTCRAPYCDSEVCAKCPRGCGFCLENSPNPLRKLLHKVMGMIVFLAAFIVEESVILEMLGRFIRRI